MSDHLTKPQVQRYRDRSVTPEELLSIDAHISGCSSCASLIADPYCVRESLELWRGDFDAARSEPNQHISYEQQVVFVDNAAAPAEREVVESHLKNCVRCSEEIADLQRFSTQFTAPNTEKAERRAPKTIEKTEGWWRRPRLWIPLQAAAAVLLITVFVWMLTAPIRSRNAELKARLAQVESENQEVAQQNGERKVAIENLQSQISELQKSYLNKAGPEPDNGMVVALNDGDAQVTLDRSGNLNGLSGLPAVWQQMARTALITEQIQPPPAVFTLIGKTGALMGGSGNGIAFNLLGPVGTAVLSDRPVFRWSPVEGAGSYSIAVYDANFNLAAAGDLIAGTTWTSPSALRRGGSYFWQVTANKDGKAIKSPVPPAPEARFSVLDQSKLEEVSQLRKTASNSHLALGLIFTKEGLLEDAQRELELLVRANPTSAFAQTLLRNLKGLRRAKR